MMMLKSSIVFFLSLPLTAITHAIPATDASPLGIPTIKESAILARRIIHLSKIGTLSTVFQPSSAHSQHDVDADISDDLAGIPIGLPDYFADCDPQGDGNPTILAIDIATPFRNVRSGSNISLGVEWVPPYPPSKRISMWSRLSNLFAVVQDTPDTAPYSSANLPRFSLIGYLEALDNGDADHDELAQCFVAKHPDARYWLPGNRIHRSRWVRLVVTHVYWVGGFGDRAYIGWIPAELYNSVSHDEWEAIRLPGEKPGWKEWSTGSEL